MTKCALIEAEAQTREVCQGCRGQALSRLTIALVLDPRAGNALVPLHRRILMESLRQQESSRS